MKQMASYVDWMLVGILVVAASGWFVQYSIKLWKRELFTALASLGMGLIAGVLAVRITYADVLLGTGAASVITFGCFILGIALLTVGFIGSIPRLRLPLIHRGKHASGGTVSPTGTV